MQDELSIIRRILSGDEEAWHRFTIEHTPLIRHVINHYIWDEELASDLYVSFLEKLKSNKLQSFTGKSTLSTWLFAVVRNHCRDYIRNSTGVRYIQSALAGLDKLDARFFQLHYIDGLPFHEVLRSLRLEFNEKLSYIDLINCDRKIKAHVSKKKLGNLLERLLRPEPLPVVQTETETYTSPDSGNVPGVPIELPGFFHRERELAQAILNLREAIEKLPYREQIVLKLRFEHRASARRICEVLDIGNEKQVYRKLKKILADLKKSMLERGDIPADEYRDLADNIESLCCMYETWNEPGRSS